MKKNLLGRAIEAFRSGGMESLLRGIGIFTRRRFYRALIPFESINAQIEAVDVPQKVVAACMYRIRFRVQNRSRVVWNASNSPRFCAGAIILDGNEVLFEVESVLPPNVEPNGFCDMELVLEIPRKPGKYTLKIDLVRENCYWFAEIGHSLFEMPLQVDPHSLPLLSSRVPSIDVTLDITNKCPLKCIQCRKTYFETFDEQQDMNFDLFRKISAEVFPHAHSVMLSSAGEPLMTRGLFEAIELTRQQRVRDISFISAGFHLNPARAEKIIESGVTRIEFSIDGASSGVYNKIRIGSDFNKVVKNISYLNELKKKKGLDKPLLRFNFVLMKSNIHELPAFIDLAATLGVEEVQCQHMVIFVDSMKEEALVFDKERSNTYIEEARERAKAHHIRFYHPPLFTIDAEEQDSKKEITDGKIWMEADAFDFERKTHPVLQDGQQLCTDPWRKIFIDWQGQVFPCCVWKEEPLGDLKRNTFLEIWESPRYRQLREGLTTGKLGKSCAECSVITGGDVNREQSYFFS